MTDAEVKQQIEENFRFLSEMTVPEYTLYRKWLELSRSDWNLKERERIQHVKNNIWMPSSTDDYKNLNIKVIWAEDADTLLTWRIIRLFTSTMPWNQNPGRNLRFYVVHEEPGNDPFGFGFSNPVHKYLGTISLGSDFIAIGGRDEVIKWTSDNKMKDGMLRHTAMGSSIVPTQPLGYNYLGGKLVSLLVLSDTVENAWNQKYNEKLVGVTTTSLYGGFSQYNNLKYWKKCKSSEGMIPMEPSEETYEVIKDFCKERYPLDYESFVTPKNADSNGCSIPSHPKTKVMQKVFKELKIKPPKNNASRGVYWASLYEKTNEYLRRETDDPGNKLFDNSVDSLVNMWKERYATKRINKLVEDNKVSTESLFYDDIMTMTWEECRDKYIEQVGR